MKPCLRNIFAILLCLFTGFFASCEKNDSAVPLELISVNAEDAADSSDAGFAEFLQENRGRLYGMKLISAAGSVVTLGTDSPAANRKDRPSMQVYLDYDFYIGEHEVTCGDMGLVCEDSLPVTNVTYFDAVLYANARSKFEGFDTAYTYVRASYDGDGSCIGLEGLAFNPAVDAYRLPTEAEWVRVANLSWHPVQSWHNGNSEYRPHKVCTAHVDSTGICDMAGNVMEWVNDWMVVLDDTSLVDFVGGRDGGEMGERIVKGGSFRKSFSTMSVYSRVDVYPVTSASKADYVGFRLAFGAIANPHWFGSQGSASESSANVLSDAISVKAKVGTFKAKLVFRNDVTGNLAFIDYSSGYPYVVEIKDSIGSFHPDISPDGKRVAFCTGIEGVEGKSSVYVRNLDADGSGLVRLDVENAAIPRWRVLENGDTAIVFVTSAANNKSSSFFKESTWQVPFSSGRFGTPKKLFDGAFHGGVSADGRLAVTGSRMLRVLRAEPGVQTSRLRDTVWYNGEQTCNVSLNQDGSKRTLFLDFGSQTGRAFAGEPYGAHERVFVADSTGRLLQTVQSPAGHSFDHTEWVQNSGNSFVASLVNVSGAHEWIVLANVSDSVVLPLASGEELWHPSMWLDKEFILDEDDGLDPDSAGVYLVSDRGDFIASLRVKMELYWRSLDSTQTLLCGSSRMDNGVNPDLFPEWHMLNMGVAGIDAVREMFFIENYALNHADKLKYIAISIDLDNWKGAEDFLSVILNSAPGYMYDAYHGFWAESLPEGFVQRVSLSLPASRYVQSLYSSRGGSSREGSSWESTGVEVLGDSVWTEPQKIFLDEALGRLARIVDRAGEKGIKVIGIIFPQAPQYRETGSFGAYGIQRSYAAEKIAWLDSLAKAKPNFYLMDENKMGFHDYVDDEAENQDHLSSKGAAKLTARLDSLLREIEGE